MEHLQRLRDGRAEARDLRDGRQEPRHRHQERGPGQGDRRRAALGVRVRRAEVLGVLARLRGARGLRRLPRAAEGRRPRRSRSATRSSATSTSGRSSTRPPSRRSRRPPTRRAKNGTLVTGGERITEGDLGRGLFVEPTVVEAPDDSWLWKKELFVPFVAVAPFDELDDAIEQANDTEYGLTAGFFSEDQAEVDEWLDRIQAGVVYVNRRAGATTGAWPGVQPFGGWKGSGTTGKAGGGPYYVTLYLREQSRTVICGVSLEDVELEAPRERRGAAPDHRTPGAGGAGGPGPRRARDEPVAAARVPVRAQAGLRVRGGGRRRQPVPRPERGDRRDLDGALSPEGGGGDPGAGGRADPLLGERLLPADLLRGRRAAGRDRADVGPRPLVPHELGDRGGRGGHQARALGDGTAVHHGVLQLVPRPVLRERVAHGVEGDVPGGVRAAAAGRAPRLLRRRPRHGDGAGLRRGRLPHDRLHRALPVQARWSRRTRWRRSSSSRCWARAATSCRPTAG